jgi:hypothetical protein
MRFACAVHELRILLVVQKLRVLHGARRWAEDVYKVKKAIIPALEQL